MFIETTHPRRHAGDRYIPPPHGQRTDGRKSTGISAGKVRFTSL